MYVNLRILNLWLQNWRNFVGSMFRYFIMFERGVFEVYVLGSIYFYFGDFIFYEMLVCNMVMVYEMYGNLSKII